MATTVTAPEEGPRESSAARSRSWLLRSIISVTAVAVAVVAGVALLADSDDETLTATGSDVEFTYVHEFDGNLDDVRGGPSLVATGGTFGSEGFVFERGDGLRAGIDLGDSYAIEFRISHRRIRTPLQAVRLQRSGHRRRSLRLCAGRNAAEHVAQRGVKAGVLLPEGCDGRTDQAQGCWSPSGSTREALLSGPYEIVCREWVTVRFARDVDTNALSTEIDGTVQTWEVGYPAGKARKDATVQPVDHADDFMGEATQVDAAPLHVRSTTGIETSSGELDYLKNAAE